MSLLDFGNTDKMRFLLTYTLHIKENTYKLLFFQIEFAPKDLWKVYQKIAIRIYFQRF